MKFKKITILIIPILLICLCTATELSGLEGAVSRESMQRIHEIMPNFTFDGMIESLQHGIDLAGIGDKILNMFIKEIRITLKTLLPLIALMMVSGLLTKLCEGSSVNITQMGFFACFAVAIVVCLASYRITIDYCITTVNDLCLFVQVAAPAFGVLMVSAGKGAQSMGLQPVVVLASQATAYILSAVIMPTMHVALALALCGNLSDKLPLSKMSQLVKSATRWVMCGTLTIFVALLGICSAVGGGMDAVVGKTARFAISGVPVAGGIIADATDVVAASAVLLKNAGGAAAIVFIFLLAIAPLLKIFVIMLTYKFLSAACQCVSDKRLSNVLDEMSGVISIGFTCTFCAAALMIITMGVFVAV